jgi:hypothetical protein
MKDMSLRVVLYILPVVLAIAAAVFIARAGTVAGPVEQAPHAADMNVPF